MVTTTPKKNAATPASAAPKRPNGSVLSGRKSNASSNYKNKRRVQKARDAELPSWLAAAVSVIGVGVAVGAGLYATRHQWMPKAENWRDDFSAAFADDETDHENFDQTRGAGAHAMRDHPGDDWDDIDHMSDASFPASDPPSFTPGVA